MLAITAGQALQTAAALHAAGRLSEAEAICRRILTQHPRDAGALHRLGLIAATGGRYEETAELLSAAILVSPAHPLLHANLAEAFRRLGRLDDSIECLRRALEWDAELPEIHLRLGQSLIGAGRADEAIAAFRRTLSLRPACIEACDGLGIAQMAQGDMEEAILSFRSALALDANYAPALNNLGNAFLEVGRGVDALASFRRALDARPDLSGIHVNVAHASLLLGHYQDAMASFRLGLDASPGSPEIHLGLAYALLLLGQYEEGWKEHEWRWQCSSFSDARRNFSAMQWDGKPAPGETILVHAEQGFGDALQFARFLPLVRERAGARHVILECHSSLVRLLAHSATGRAEIVARHVSGESRLPSFDRHVPLLSLPLTLGIFPPLPMTEPYLHADPALCATWRERIGRDSAFRVGLAWAGSATHADDRRRSIACENLLPLLDVPGVRFYSVQVPSCPRQSRILTEHGLIDLTTHITDFADTAALMAELDLVISVDTAAAHLAGALGRPVWTLLPFVPDWRWGLECEDTPWYPTMRLFRQLAPGDWGSVLQKGIRALQEASDPSDRT